MNIRDLSPDEYTVEEPSTPKSSIRNINKLPSGSYKFDDAKAALAQSKNTLDTLKTKAAEAKKNADYQNSPMGMLAGTAQGTGKGVAQGVLGPAVKAGRGALQGLASLFGQDPHYTDTYTNFEGKPEMTSKGEVLTGQKTPLEATLGFALDAATVLPVGIAAKEIGTGLKEAATAAKESKLLSPVAKFAEENIGPAISKVTTPIKDLASGAYNAVKNKVSQTIGGKTLETILATPESQVYKLSTAERKAYFDAQKSTIEDTAAQAGQKIKTGLQASTMKAQEETAALTKQLETASRDEVVSLRPKIKAALGKQSQIYRDLVDKEIAQHADVVVKPSELGQYIETRFAENPEMGSAVKQRLGLGTEGAYPRTVPSRVPGELPSIQIAPKEAPSTTIGKIYEQTKALRQDIGTAATKGARTYTSDEKLTDDAINTLSSFMKSKGVDLSEANQFWSQYAPVRNQLVTEAKPFVTSGTQTKTFANTLTRAAKGTDINNENFIQSVEEILGESLAKEQKQVVAKLGQAEKAQLATKTEAEVALMEKDLAKEKALKKMSEKEFETARQARLRTIIKRGLSVYGAYKAGQAVERTTGIDIPFVQ